MTEQDLIKGKTLLDLIKTTEIAIIDLNKWLDSKKSPTHLDGEDNNFFFHLCEHGDGSGCSGFNVCLNRSFGNTLILQKVKAELEERLS